MRTMVPSPRVQGSLWGTEGIQTDGHRGLSRTWCLDRKWLRVNVSASLRWKRAKIHPSCSRMAAVTRKPSPRALRFESPQLHQQPRVPAHCVVCGRPRHILGSSGDVLHGRRLSNVRPRAGTDIRGVADFLHPSATSPTQIQQVAAGVTKPRADSLNCRAGCAPDGGAALRDEPLAKCHRRGQFG